MHCDYQFIDILQHEKEFVKGFIDNPFCELIARANCRYLGEH